ncbi:MAG: hypothetical protein ABI647_20420 [Gemmatimonadota bacterium]
MLPAFLRRGWPLRAVMLLGLAGCSKSEILQPDTPDIIDPASLDNLQGAPAIYAGAISEMVFAHTSSIRGIVNYTGLFTDELLHAGTPPATREFDLRKVLATNLDAVGTVTNPGPYHLLHRARTALESAARRIAAIVPAGDARVGELWALAGMTYIEFAEDFCSGTPFSEREPEETLGSPFTTVQILNRGLERLTTAAGAGSASALTTGLIAVLKGRALLDLGQFGPAAQAVAAVPTSFVYQFSQAGPPSRQPNQIFQQNSGDTFSVPDREGTNGLDFASAQDPRVPVSAPRPSRQDGVSPQVYFLKYTTVADPVPMVTGIEARLIEAEAALQANDTGGWLDKLNAARATVAALAPLTDPGTQAARVDLTFRERAFWMFLTGHRLGDLRRLVRQYTRPAESVYPTGAYHKQGLTRGTQLTLIVPQPEQNNPNFHASDCAVDSP